MLASSWVVIAKNYGPHTKWDWSWIENEYGYHASASAAGIYGTNVPTLLSAANLKSTGLIYQNKAFTDKHTESNKRQPLVMNDSFLKRKAKQSIKICIYYIYILSHSPLAFRLWMWEECGYETSNSNRDDFICNRSPIARYNDDSCEWAREWDSKLWAHRKRDIWLQWHGSNTFTCVSEWACEKERNMELDVLAYNMKRTNTESYKKCIANSRKWEHIH